MTKKIGIIDYAAGNLLSIKRAIESFNLNAIIVERCTEVFSCDALILPGVGAFRDGMRKLEEHGFVEHIREYISHDRPLLGICLGMQLLFENSDEFGYCSGLGLIKGAVKKLPTHTTNHVAQKIPHIGWSAVNATQESLFADIPKNAEYYFCHSFEVHPVNGDHAIAYYEYGGHQVTAAVNSNSIYGFQFHPEKSGLPGLRLIKCFLHKTGII